MGKYLYQNIKNCKWKYDNEIKQKIDKEIIIINKNIIYRDKYLEEHKNENSKRSVDSNRNEEWVCKDSYKFHPDLNNELGKIIDYQVPLKIPKKNIPLKMQKNCDEINNGRGKIDLILKNDKTKTVYLIEVKVSNNTENPCKAVLEIYTYYNLLGGKNRINEFLNKIDCIGYKCKTAILFEKSKNNNNYEGRFDKDTGNVKELAKALGVECYNFEVKVNGDKTFIERINRVKI